MESQGSGGNAVKNDRFLIRMFFTLFVFSGAAALIYEVVWVRQFSRVLGASAYAVTIILSTFMAGIGIGSWFIGKKTDRLHEKGLVRTYVLLEIGIGAYSLLLPVFLDWAEAAYVAFYLSYEPSLFVFNGFRLALASLLLVIPTTFIGATLPVLSRFMIRRSTRIPMTISKLYALNTLGAYLAQ